MKRTQDFNGNWYKSYAAMCRTYRVSSSLVRKRLEAGWSLEEALTGKRYKVYDHTGQGFRSVVSMCRAWGIKESVYRDRITLGYTVEDALTKSVRGVYGRKACTDTEGNEYRSMSAMCREHGVSNNVFYSRIRSGCSMEEALTKGRLPRVGRDGYTDHKGNKYSTIREMCKAWGISSGTYMYRIKKGMNVEQALTWDRYAKVSL